MKILKLNADNLVIDVFEDDEVLDVQENKTLVGNPVHMVHSNIDTSNSTIVTDVTPPSDYANGRYMYSDGTWTANESWRDPETITE